jgi:chromosome partitioning protein
MMVNMIVTPFAREVKRLRTERGLTIRDLAAALGKSVAYLAKIEVQGEIPAPQFTCELARYLEVDVSALLRLAKEARIANTIRDIDRTYTRVLAEAALAARNEELRNDEKEADTMATVISLINMKGGVGKTTLAMQLAHAADQMNLKTLAVDLDPQANLSQVLMGPERYVDYIREQRPTIVQIFDEYVPASSLTTSPRLLNVNEVVVKQTGFWQDSTLDLIPSRLELSRTLKNPTGKERRLAKALAQVRKQYDLVIIDCAPTESVLTDAAYFASRYVVVPIKPEFMATIGLPLLARSLQEFRLENEDHEIEIAGLVFNHSSSYSSGPEGQQSIRDVTKVAKENGWPICENQVRYSASYAKSAREGTPLAHTSYSRSDVVKSFQRLTSEIFELIGLSKVAA